MVRRWVVAGILCVSLSVDATGLQTALVEMKEKSSLALAQYDIDMKLGGRVRHETFNFTSPLVFRSDYFDRYTFQRAKFNFDVDSSFGKRTYGSSAIDARIRLTSFNVVDNYDVYTPIVLETVSFSSKNYIKKSDIGDHQHDSTVTLAYLEDGYVDVKLDKLLPIALPVAFRIGYFPFLLGRGLALGDYYGGAVDALGWREKGNVGNTTQRHAGITLTAGDPEDFAVQAYYCKWKKLSQGPDHTRKETRARRLDRDDQLRDPRAIERGHNADRDLFALRGMITHKPVVDGFSSYVEPYVVYVNAPELEVEAGYEGDASAKLGTVGCMVDWSYNGWNINVEAGVQFGHQVMHPIDRNHLIYDDAYYSQTASAFNGQEPIQSVVAGRLDKQIGFPATYHSHVFLGFQNPSTEKEEYLPYRAYYVSDELKNINAHRTVMEQGGKIYTSAPEKTDTQAAGELYVSKKQQPSTGPGGYSNGSLYSQYQFKSGIDYLDTLVQLGDARPNGFLYNANLPFGGASRFRDKYTIDFKGFMVMADISYTLPSKKATMSFAVGHISGDDDPFNTEVDKAYNGFVPLRDANYEGRNVKSYAVLSARKIARPSTYSERLLYAQNHFESITNLQYIGFGSVIRPCVDRTELTIESNLLYFWESQAPFTWDSKAARDFGSDKVNGIWSKLQDDFHFTGYQTTTRASRQLGLEFNTVLTWAPLPSIEIRALFATFLPGKLFRDIDGTPNAYAVRLDADGDVHLDSLGHKVPFGGMIRLTYFF